MIDEVLTLQEAHRTLAERGVDLATAPAAGWDAPAAGAARVFPLPGGLLESAGLDRGILDPDVLVVSGHSETVEVLDSLGTAETGRTLLVEALMCKGCYCGPGISSDEPGLLRKRRVGEYVAESRRREQAEAPVPAEAAFGALLLSRTYGADDQRDAVPEEEEIRDILAHTNKFFPEDELDCGACGYPTCRAKAIAVHSGMAEEAMCLPFMIEQAERVCNELNVPWADLREVHRHLINTEKLASMGQMAAGVAHELNNPLSTILLYTHILGKKLADRDDLDHDLKLVKDESERCKKIVGNLLDFARQSRVHVESVDVEDLVRQAVDGAACTLEPSNVHEVSLETDVTPGLHADLDRDQMHAGPRQPGQERRGGHGRPLGRRAGDRLRDARATPPAHRRERRGRRHPAERPRQGLPAVLHDQEHRQGHRSGPADQLRHRQDAPGHHLVRLRGGAGHDVSHRAAHDSRHPRKEHDGMTPSFTILFVDDDRDFLDAKRVYFEARGHTVLTAEAPDEALGLLETTKPDIIFLDLMMDQIDSGFRLGYQIGKDERLRDVPLVMLSGVAAETGRRFDGEAEGLRAWSGLDQFIDKPVTGKQLLKVVEERAGAAGHQPAGAAGRQ